MKEKFSGFKYLSVMQFKMELKLNIRDNLEDCVFGSGFRRNPTMNELIRGPLCPCPSRPSEMTKDWKNTCEEKISRHPKSKSSIKLNGLFETVSSSDGEFK